MQVHQALAHLRPVSLARPLVSRRAAAPVAAWSAAVLSGVLGLLGIALMAINTQTGTPADRYWGAGAVFAFVYPAIGALIASRHPSNPVGWLFIAIGLSTAGIFAGQYVIAVGLGLIGMSPVAIALAWLSAWVGDVGFMLGLFVFLLFPDGRVPSPRWRPVAWATGVVIACRGLSLAFKPGPIHGVDWGAFSANPFGLDLPEGVWWLLGVAPIPLGLVGLVGSVAAPFWRWRHTSGDERQQLKWFAYGVALVLISLVGNAIFPDLAWAIGGLSTLLLALAIGVAILKYRLYDIDLLINRTLVYAALSACVVGLYVLVVGYLAALFHTTGNPSTGSGQGLVVSLAATGLVAVLFQPLREWLQRAVNRLLYGERDEPYRVLSRLGQRLGATIAPEAVLPIIVQTVAEALRLPYAAIALEHNGAFAVAASTGQPRAQPIRLPLAYQEDPVGELLLGARAPGEHFNPADRRLLEDLAHQAGVAVHAVRLTAELQRSRERLVVAREEERRRLRRDLHDGLGPALAAQTLKVGSARTLVERDPPAADRLLAGLEDDIERTLADIRRLVYNLRPPALDELGLEGATRESAAQYSTAHAGLTAADPVGGLRISVEAPERLPPLPAAVEVAAYRIVQEALANVVRHAQARNCQVRLWLETGLQVEVVDDGVGLPVKRRTGVGLTSMRERAEELGGTFDVEPHPRGGTRMRASLPLPQGAIPA